MSENSDPLLPDDGSAKEPPKPPTNGASFASSVCNMSIAILGPGLLSVPYALSASGLLLGTAMMMAALGLNMYTVMLLLDSALRLPNSVEPTFESVVRHGFGKRAEQFLVLNIALYLFGCVCGNLIAIMKLGAVFVHWCGLRISAELLLVLLVCLVELPLCCVRDLDTLGRFSSPLGVFSLCAVAAVVVVQALTASSWGPDSTGWPDPPLLPEGRSLLLTFPIATFSFSAQPYVLPLLFHQVLPRAERPSGAHVSQAQREDGEPLSRMQPYSKEDRRKALRVVYAAMALCALLYMATGLFGVLQLGDLQHVKSNVLLSYPADDAVACITSAVMTVAVATCLPINIFPLRQLLCAHMGVSEGSGSESHWAYIGLQGGLILALATVTACFVSNLGKVFDVTGATACLTCCYVLPCLAAAKWDGRWSWQTLCTLAIGTAGSLLSLWVIFSSPSD